jgi:hypothetical protein
VSVKGESVVSRQRGAPAQLDVGLSTGSYPAFGNALAGTSAGQAPATTTTAGDYGTTATTTTEGGYGTTATTTTAGGYGTTVTAGGYPWESDPQYPGYQRRWNGYAYERKPTGS